MSAIERDREIAAKATQGEWSWLYSKCGCGVVLDSKNDAAEMTHEEKEHIVRLHSRQPLYDALVDAVREMVDCSCEDILECEFYIKTEHALDALDQEDQP